MNEFNSFTSLRSALHYANASTCFSQLLGSLEEKKRYFQEHCNEFSDLLDICVGSVCDCDSMANTFHKTQTSFTNMFTDFKSPFLFAEKICTAFVGGSQWSALPKRRVWEVPAQRIFCKITSCWHPSGGLVFYLCINNYV